MINSQSVNKLFLNLRSHIGDREMTDDEKEKKTPRFPFDFNFNDFLKQFEDQIRNLKELMDSNALEPGQPMIWGYSTHIGPDGVPRVRQFGNVNQLNPYQIMTSHQDSKKKYVNYTHQKIPKL